MEKEKIIKLIEKLTIKIKEGSISFNVSDDYNRIHGPLKIDKEKSVNILIEKNKKKYILWLQLVEETEYRINYKDKLFFTFHQNNENYKDIECFFNLAIEQKKKSFYEQIEKLIEEI